MAAAIDRKKPFTGELIRLYELDENRPPPDARRALAKVFDKTESYIEFGDSKQEAREPAPSYAAGLAPDVDRLIRAYTWLMDEERDALLKELEAKAETNKQIAKRLGPRFKFASDERVLEALKRGGDFPPGSKKKQTAKRRRPPTFREEDPE